MWSCLLLMLYSACARNAQGICNALPANAVYNNRANPASTTPPNPSPTITAFAAPVNVDTLLVAVPVLAGTTVNEVTVLPSDVYVTGTDMEVGTAGAMVVLPETV